MTVTIPADRVTDPAGNSNTVSNVLRVTFDSAAPGPTLSTTETSPTNSASATITVDFGEPIDGATFTLDDISVTGGDASVLAPGGRDKVYCWVVAPSWARTEASPPVTEMSSSVKVAGSIGSPKSTVTVTDAALVGEVSVVDRVGPGVVLSKVTRSTLDAVLSLPAGSMTRSAGIVTVTWPSELGVTVKVYCWVVAPSWGQDGGVPAGDGDVIQREGGAVDRLAKVDGYGGRGGVGRGGLRG